MKKISNIEKQRKPIIVTSTDLHITDTDDSIMDLMRQQCDLADELGVNLLMCLGDVFNSRIGQKVNTLELFAQVLDYIHDRGKEILIIPGNHDKQNYKGDESFLSPFRHFPGVNIISEPNVMSIGGNFMYFLPYYEESIWLDNLKMLREIAKNNKNKEGSTALHILFSHQAVNGSVNNDGSVVKCGISTNDLLGFDSVFLGHYHDYQQPMPNVYHLPSIKQNNFGENDNKGFTVLMDDGSFEIVNSSFKTFIKHKIDLSKVDIKEVLKQVRNNINPEINQRWELVGSKSLLKSVPKAELESLGVSIILTDVELESFVQYAEEEIVEYNQQSIMDEFKEFCDERSYDVEKGTNYLKNKLGI